MMDGIRRFTLALTLALCTVFPVQAAVTQELATPANDSVDSTREYIGQAYARARNQDLEGAASALDLAIRSPGFAELEDIEQYTALSLAARISLDKRGPKRAYALFRRSSSYPYAEGGDWHGRLSGAFVTRDYGDAAYCVATIATRWPQTLDEINNQAIFMIAAALQGDAEKADFRFEMLSALFAAGWTVDGGQPNYLWSNLADELVRRGEVKQAALVASRIDSARAVLAMSVDKRFDPIVRRGGIAFDVEKVAMAELQAAERRATDDAQQLRPIIELQYLLLDTLQAERALALADEVVDRVRDGKGPSIYRDFKSDYIWILDNRSRALQRLGRWDEAVAQQRKAALRPENGDMNVSQALNLGLLLAELDHPDEALSAVADLGDMSPYGRMQLELVRLMAAVERNDAPEVQRHLDFMREHRSDAPSTYQDALLSAERLDEAADLILERLRSESLRGAVLTEIQEYAEVPSTPRQAERSRRRREVLSRPQVQAELKKVGRIASFRLGPPFS